MNVQIYRSFTGRWVIINVIGGGQAGRTFATRAEAIAYCEEMRWTIDGMDEEG